MKKSSLKILFIKRGSTRFENNDINLLKDRFDLKIHEPNLFSFFELFGLVYNTDIIYYWFPNDYKFIFSIIAKLLRKKVFIVGGGQMSTADNSSNRKFANVKYRFFHIPLGILSLKIANKVIAVSKYEMKGLLRYVNPNKLKLIYNSIDTSKFNLQNLLRDDNLIVTVSALKDTHYHRKGLDTFIRISKLFPNKKFFIIGKDHGDGTFDKIKNLKSSNLFLKGFVDDFELISILNQASVYCQFSRQEGFGVSLAEAIACGCIPLTSDYAAIPEVSGSNGYYIDRNPDDKNLKDTLKRALNASVNERKNNASRVVKLFDHNKRKNLLYNEFDI